MSLLNVMVKGASSCQGFVWDFEKVANLALEYDMPLNECNSHLLVITSEELPVVEQNGELLIGAIRRNMNLGIIMAADCRWAN